MFENKTESSLFINVWTLNTTENRIGCVIVCVLALSVVDHWLEPRLLKPKTMKLVFDAAPLSIQL